MTFDRIVVGIGILLIAGLFVPTEPRAQPSDGPSCAGQLAEQLTRFSEKCISDLVSYVASRPQVRARIAGENEKYYVMLIKDAKGFRAEAVSKFNFPFMRDETAAALKRLGWAPPEEENDNWKKPIAGNGAPNGVVRDVIEALQAYGLKQGEAISLTVGTEASR